MVVNSKHLNCSVNGKLLSNISCASRLKQFILVAPSVRGSTAVQRNHQK